jgi:AraC family transcriptional regulator
MIPRIETLTEKKLIGSRIRMRLSDNRTGELWRDFMSRRKEIKNSVGADLFSIEVYDRSLDFRDFNPDTEFEKWAAVEVSKVEPIPENMEAYILTGGLYAVFIYKGDGNDVRSTFEYIFRTWLPNSDYILDERPHFEVMGEKYQLNDPKSEEEFWIPIKMKSSRSSD